MQHFQNLIWSTFGCFPHGRPTLFYRSIHILSKTNEKIGGHVLNKKIILSCLHAPLFLIFSKMLHPKWYPSYFHFHIISKTVTNPVDSITRKPYWYSSLPSSTKNATFYR